jgi:GNAT superfamily N-acetyltransferase
MDVRRMGAQDLDAARAILAEAGYDRPPEEFRAAFADAAARPDHLLLVAVDDGRVIGWLHAFASRPLHDEPFADVAALVVAAGSRLAGAGTALIRAAEQWGVANGCAWARVRSRLSREGAHRFYVRLGYAKEKTQYTFAAPLR